MNNTFVIKIYVDDESELYNSFDKEHLTPNDEVVSYIVGKLPNRRLNEKTVIELVSDNEIDKEQFKKALNNQIKTEEASNKREKNLELLKQVFLVFVGLMFITLSFYISKFDVKMLSEISSIIGTFSIWEATNIWLIDTRRINATGRQLERMKNTEIR